MPPRPTTAILFLFFSSLTSVRVATAQEAVVTGGAEVQAGFEGGGSGYASGVRRTRTKLRFSAEAYVDEFPTDIAALGAIIELEPTASIGADLKYLRRFGERVYLNAGVTSVIAPKHLIGATFGMDYRFNFKETLALVPSVTSNVYFVGADLAGSNVIWQLVFGVGVRFGL